MTNERVYKKEQPNEMAIDEIKRCSGSQFDPGVVKAFVKVMETGAAE